MKTEETCDLFIEFEKGEEIHMSKIFCDEVAGNVKKEEDSLKSTISRLVNHIARTKYPYINMMDINSTILKDCIGYIMSMDDSKKTKQIFKSDPDRIKNLIISLANRRISINKACTGNYVLPEFASAVLTARVFEMISEAIYSGVNDSKITALGVTDEQLNNAIKTIISRLSEDLQDLNRRLDIIKKNYIKNKNIC